MVFKRYIIKDGKKLGPYYYKNIKEGGKVKSIYLGTNPEEAQEKETVIEETNEDGKSKLEEILPSLSIKANVIILILVILIFLFTMSYQTGKLESLRETLTFENVNQFEINPYLIKVLLKQGDFIIKTITITNNIKDTSIIVSNPFENLIEISEDSFTLKKFETKVIPLKFLTSNIQKNVEFSPGIYVGKLAFQSDMGKNEIPLIIEVESKSVLFDSLVNILASERKVFLGDNLIADVSIFNLGAVTASYNVNIEYSIKDLYGNYIITDAETIPIRDKISFSKTIAIPKNLKTGDYIFSVVTKYGSSTGTSSYIFSIIKPEEKTGFINLFKENPVYAISLIIFILLLFIISSYFYFLIGSKVYGKLHKIKPEKHEGIKIRLVKGKVKERYTFLKIFLFLTLVVILFVIVKSIVVYKNEIYLWASKYLPFLTSKLKEGSLFLTNNLKTVFPFLLPEEIIYIIVVIILAIILLIVILSRIRHIKKKAGEGSKNYKDHHTLRRENLEKIKAKIEEKRGESEDKDNIKKIKSLLKQIKKLKDLNKIENNYKELMDSYNKLSLKKQKKMYGKVMKVYHKIIKV